MAKFAAAGKQQKKKDLGLLAMTYGDVYVARIAFGAKDNQTIRAFLEAESFDGPSLIIAYAHCIAHGYDMVHGLRQQDAAVKSGYWPLFRYDPRLRGEGRNPFQLDSRAPNLPLEEYVYKEGRYRMLQQKDPQGAADLLALAKADVQERWATYERLAAGNGHMISE